MFDTSMHILLSVFRCKSMFVSFNILYKHECGCKLSELCCNGFLNPLNVPQQQQPPPCFFAWIKFNNVSEMYIIALIIPSKATTKEILMAKKSLTLHFTYQASQKILNIISMKELVLHSYKILVQIIMDKVYMSTSAYVLSLRHTCVHGG